MGFRLAEIAPAVGRAAVKKRLPTGLSLEVAQAGQVFRICKEARAGGYVA
jgi:hypothetical protein